MSDTPTPDLSLRTPRLLLQLARQSHRDEFIRIHENSREHLAATTPTPRLGLSGAETWDRYWANATEAHARGTGASFVGFLLRDRADGEPAQLVGIFNLNNLVRGAYLCAAAGWHLDVDCIGRGLATEGVTALLDLAFAPSPRGLGLHRVQANIVPANRSSLRVAEKCGFRREGVALQMLHIAGRWQDHIMFAKLADEHAGVYLTPP